MKAQLFDDNGDFVPLGADAPAVLVMIVKSDATTGAELFGAYAFETVPAADVAVDPQLRWARLDPTVTGIDWTTGATFPVSIDMVWSATGPFVRFRGTEHRQVVSGSRHLRQHQRDRPDARHV